MSAKIFLFAIIFISLIFINSEITYAQPKITAELKADSDTYTGQCPATIKFFGKITVTNISNPPLKVQYKFIRNDGAHAPVNTIIFDKDGSKMVNTTWTLGGSELPEYKGWQAIKVVYPQDVESNKANFKIKCQFSELKDKDKDEDGIDDAKEEELLKRFRPYYKFSKKGDKHENYRPSDAIYQLRWSQLKNSDWPPGSEPDTVKNCGDEKESYHITPPKRILDCLDGKLDLLKNSKKTSYYLNISDSKRKGPEWPDAIAHAPGLYGHVVKSGNLIKIEYWQFFGYSGQDVTGGDHEGDWCTLQLYYDPATDKLVKTEHWAHGKGIAFDLTKTKNIVDLGNNFFEYRGPNYNSDPGSLHWDYKKAKEQPRYPSGFQNNTVRFYKINNELHPVVYIERDAHEFWPTEHGSFPFANEHNGNGTSYLVAYIPGKINLGEIKNPLSEEAEIILRYNGFWGCYHHKGNDPPPGPTLHCQWTFPSNEKDLEEKIKSKCEH